MRTDLRVATDFVSERDPSFILSDRKSFSRVETPGRPFCSPAQAPVFENPPVDHDLRP